MEDEDDLDDVNWEDESGDEEEEVGGEGAEVKLNNEPISISIATGPAQKTKRGPKKDVNKKVVFTEDDHEDCFQRCEYDMEKWISFDSSMARACCDKALQSEVTKLLPVALTEAARPEPPYSHWIEVIRWIRDNFRSISVKDMTVEEGRDGSDAADLINFVLKNKAGSRHQLNQVFVAAMLTMHYQVRLVTTVDPVSWSPQEHADVYRTRWEAVQGANSTAKFKDRKYSKPGEKFSWVEVFYDPSASTNNVEKGRRSSAVTVLDDAVDLTEDGETELSNQHTTAASTSSSKPSHSDTKILGTSKPARWIHLDPYSQRIDLPTHVEDVLRKTRPLQYVLAFEYKNYPENSPWNRDTYKAHSDSRDSSLLISTTPAMSMSVKVVDVTSTYKLQHHYSTRRDKEARARMESWLTSHLINLNEEICSHKNAVTITQARSKSQSSGIVDLCSDDDGVVDLTMDDCEDRNDYLCASKKPVYKDKCSSSTANSSSSYSSAQPFEILDDTDYVDFTEDDVEIPTSPASSAAGKRNRNQFEDNNQLITSISATSSSEKDAPSCPMPSRMQDFKDHPVYCLERHLLSEQALHPNAQAVGVFKGESVYLLRHKETLRTKLQWRRVLKQVRRNEETVKVIQRRVRAQDSGGDAQGQSEDKTIELKLFGSWQTEPIQVSILSPYFLILHSCFYFTNGWYHICFYFEYHFS